MPKYYALSVISVPVAILVEADDPNKAVEVAEYYVMEKMPIRDIEKMQNAEILAAKTSVVATDDTEPPDYSQAAMDKARAEFQAQLDDMRKLLSRD